MKITPPVLLYLLVRPSLRVFGRFCTGRFLILFCVLVLFRCLSFLFLLSKTCALTEGVRFGFVGSHVLDGRRCACYC